MYRTLCVMALVVLCTELAHSFSWDVVVAVRNGLQFIDSNGRITHTEKLTWTDTNYFPTYDPVHDRVLFADANNVYSFDIAKNKTESLIVLDRGFINGLAYDPATELLFWCEERKRIYSISLKPELRNNYNSKVIEKHLFYSKTIPIIYNIAIDSCGGFIYLAESCTVIKVPINGPASELEIVFVDYDYENVFSLSIDQYSQKMYFSDEAGNIKSADLNGNNMTTIFRSTRLINYMTVSKDFIYCKYYNSWHKKYEMIQISKNPSRSINVKPKMLSQVELRGSMAANYYIEDITRENQNCDTLKSLLPNNSVSTDVSPLYDSTKVSGESRCECTQRKSGERCDCEISMCHNFCFQGNCRASAEGRPKCSCYAGYTGERCQVDLCQGYCLHGGVCSLSAESKPLCRCTEHYEGERCHVPVFQIKCAISLLKDILDTDVTSDKAVKSSCSTTTVQR